MTILRLFISSDLDEQALHEWIVLDSSGEVVRHGKSDFSGLPVCHETEVVIPTCLVNFVDIKLPEVTGKRLDAILPYIAEEYVLSGPEEVHVVIVSRLGDQAILAIVQKAWMKELISRLSKVKVQAKRMFPDCLLLTMQEDAWAIAKVGSGALVRTSQAQGFAFDLDSCDQLEVPFLLNLAFEEKDQFSRPRILLAYNELVDLAKGWATKLGLHSVIAMEESWRSNKLSTAFNLLQKEFAPPNDWIQRLYQFKSCAILAGMILALQFSFTLIELGEHYHQSHQLDQEMISLFKATFPEATTIVDAPLQMQRKLEEIQHAGGETANADFEPLLAIISKTIGAIPADKIISMNYQDRKMVLAFRVESLDQADAMRQKLVGVGLIATLERGRANGPLTDVQLLVTGGAK